MVAFRTPMLWAIGFIVVSTIGGLDVVTLAYVRANRSMLQDTYVQVGYEHWHLYNVVGRGVRHLRRLVLLVPQDYSSYLLRPSREASFLAVVHQRRHSRPAGHRR